MENIQLLIARTRKTNLLLDQHKYEVIHLKNGEKPAWLGAQLYFSHETVMFRSCLS
jgi:hypothetical protein